MTAEERFIALERELEDTRNAAVLMILSAVDIMAKTPAECERTARDFDEVAAATDPPTARLAKLVASEVRSFAAARRA